MPAELPNTLQHLPASAWVTIGGLTFALLLAILAFAYGVVRQLFNMLSLAAGVGVAWYGFRQHLWLPDSSALVQSTDRLLAFSALAGVLAFVLARFALRLLPWLGLVQLAGIAGWRGGLLSLIPSSFTLWVGTMSTQWLGNLYGLNNMAALVQEGTRLHSTLGTWANDARHLLEDSALGSLILKVDPLAMRPTANLTRLLIVWPNPQLFPALAAHPKTGKIFAHPLINELGHDTAVRQAIERKDYTGLLRLPQVEKAARHPELSPLLRDPGLEDAMDEILYGRAPNRR